MKERRVLEENPFDEVQSVKAEKTSVTLAQGSKYAMKLTFTPADALNRTMTWSSSDKSVATVDANGKITAVGDGSATITVTSKADSSKKVSIKVKVKKPVVPVEKVEADKTEFDLEIGDKEKESIYSWIRC